LNVTLYKKKVAKKTGREYWAAIGFYSRFGNALKGLTDLLVKETELKDFKVVCEKQGQIYELIDSLKISGEGVKSANKAN